MRKALFVLLVCCFAFGTAFAQHTLEAKLSEDKSENETEICEQGRFFIKINGESDDQGRTPVQIELENNSNTFDFLLFDRAWPKKILRKNWKVYLDVGGTAVPVEGVNLDVYQESFIPHGLGKRYTFPDIIVEEGKTYECKIPIHVAQPKPNWFSKKKKRVYEIVTYTLQISVDNRDAVYEKLEHSCDSLKTAFDEALARKEFCTHRLHKPGFEAQVMEYTYAEQNLRDQINYQLANKSWSTQSKKYKHYTVLLDEIFLVQLFSSPQQTVAARTRSDAAENRKLLRIRLWPP